MEGQQTEVILQSLPCLGQDLTRQGQPWDPREEFLLPL